MRIRNTFQFLLFFCFWTVSAGAQHGMPVVTAMSWEEASREAAMRNKLVFVAVGIKPDDPKARKLFAREPVRLFLSRYTVGIGMDMTTEAGKRFEPKLLLYPWPLYAFYRPYGDLLVVLSPEDVYQNPEWLIEKGKEALELAEVKSRNSRSVHFEEGNAEMYLAKARKENKPVFIWEYRENFQPCLLMEKNVFNLDSVADFYNRHFINVKRRVETPEQQKGEYPTYLFLNEEGRRIYKTAGYKTAAELISLGQEVLKRAEGIEFTEGSWEEVQQKAAAAKKGIFLDHYGTLSGDLKLRMQKAFRDPEVAEYFNRHFVNIRTEGLPEKEMKPPGLYFLDTARHILHQLRVVPDAAELLQEGKKTLAGEGLANMHKKYRFGNRDSSFIEAYLLVLDRAGMKKEAGQVAVSYLDRLRPEQWKEKKYGDWFFRYVEDAGSGIFKYVWEHRDAYADLWGKAVVDRKLESIWEAGAEQQVVDAEGNYKMDETGLKEYTKRLKKEKVKGWRNIIRKAKMLGAEKRGDWKTYTELAEERWNEEQIPDAELYSWGVKIKENCRDKAVRYKAARWFALAAVRIEERERLGGKVEVASYKGFFEQLVDELIR